MPISDTQCFKCSKNLQIEASSRVGRRDTCPHCTYDIHCCKNCTFYDPKSYNECRERSAERVLEKEKANYCDYFSVRVVNGVSPVEGTTPNEPTTSEKIKGKLDDLFK